MHYLLINYSFNVIPLSYLLFSLLHIKEPTLTIIVRTCRLDIPQGIARRTTHIHLKNLVCPSPPTKLKKLSPEKLGDLIVPKPSGKLLGNNINN